MARIGEIVDGKYEVLREVGRGGMSVVYLAMDKRLNKQWAIKEFRKDKDDVSKQVALKALLDEANLMKKLDHPTLPRIVDIIENNQTVYVIMDYIEGESLNKVLDAYGAQPQEAVIEWAKQLSEVLDYLHTQNPPVIYRDMKPANIMLKPDGTVRLIDFGIAREWKEGKAGDTEAIGTRGYAAPEQFGGKGQTDARTDIYSLGVTLYHLVTGKNPAEPPYEIYPIRHWNPAFSSGLEWLIQKCTQLNPGDRYQSCAEVTYVLENLDKFDTEYKKKKRSRFNLYLISLIMTIVFTLSGGGFLYASTVEKSNTRDVLVAEQRYIELVQQGFVGDENVNYYVELSEQLRDKTEKISSTGEVETGRTQPEKQENLSTISSWFVDAQMSELRQSDPKAYAEVYFNLAMTLLEKFEKSGDVDGFDKSIPYFQKVLEIEKEREEELLDASRLNIAKMYYRLSLFDKIDTAESDDGYTSDVNALAEFVGLDINEYTTDPVATAWKNDKEVLEFVINKDKDSTKTMSDPSKMRTIERVVIHLKNHQIAYCDHLRSNGGEATTMFDLVEDALNSVSTSQADRKETVKNTCNNKADGIIKMYDIALDDVELEAIK